MTTIVSTLFIALDGVAEIDPEWHFPYFDDNMGAAVAEDYAGTDVLLLGRVTYDSFAGAWPGREAAGEVDAVFAKQLGDMPKLVATRGSQDLGWRNASRTADVLAAVAALREQPGVGKVLVAGSISIVQQLLAAGELDELRLLVHPVAAQHGRRLFVDDAAALPLSLTSSAVFPTGVVRLIYTPGELPGTAAYDDAVEHLPGADGQGADGRA
jgi:dihydrofolate reductase